MVDKTGQLATLMYDIFKTLLLNCRKSVVSMKLNVCIGIQNSGCTLHYEQHTNSLLPCNGLRA